MPCAGPPSAGMMPGMTLAKIAITLPRDLVASARAAVKRGRATSVSAYVASAVRRKVQDDDLMALFDELLAETGGPSTSAERKQARRALGLANGKRR